MPSLSSLFVLGIALIGGLILSRLMKLLHLPNVTGYLFAGVLIGPYLLPLIFGDSVYLLSEESVQSLSVLTEVALGFIAFSIGGEFKLKFIRKLGAKIVVITVIQAFVTVAAVLLSLLWLPSKSDASRISTALLLGAISAATAPAATLMVVRQYRAKGPVTDTLLPVVAFDDAIGLMIFSVCFALAKMFCSGEMLTLQTVIVQPLLEILLSLAVGGVLGLLLAVLMRFFHSKANRLCMMIAAVLIGVACAAQFHLSSLLLCMMIGAVFANMRDDALQSVSEMERWTPPLYMLFFVLSGAELDLRILPQIGIIGLVYLVVRSLGKYFGARLGSSITRADRNVKNYLGITLLPQAGVAIGMAQMVASNEVFGTDGVASAVVAVVLFATLVYELIGPVLTKIALQKAGEIEPTEKVYKKRMTHSERNPK